MKPIINPSLLDQFRQAERCEYCFRRCNYPTEPHHLARRGFGGGTRFDIPENLIALGGPWDCNCHGREHDGKLKAPSGYTSHQRMMQIVAAREGMTLEDLQEMHYRLLGKHDRTTP